MLIEDPGKRGGLAPSPSPGKVAFLSSKLRRLIDLILVAFSSCFITQGHFFGTLMLSLSETLLPGNSLFNEGVSKQGPGFRVPWPLEGFPASW